MLNFNGLTTALVTPFSDEDKVDYNALHHLIVRQIDAQIPSIVILGSTGENFSINDEEYQEIIKFVVHNFTGKIKIIVGSGTNDTKSSVLRSKKAEALGADAVLTVNPYYNKPTQEGLYSHFSKIAENIDIPVILYNIPGRSAVNLDADTVFDLVNNYKNIVGIKESSGKKDQLMRLIKDSPEGFSVIAGDDDLIYPTMTLGGKGAISVISNIFPQKMKKMMDFLLSHQFNSAKTLHYQMLPVINAIMSYGTNPMGIKTLLAHESKIKEIFRLPLCRLREDDRTKLIKVFKNYCDV